MNETKLELAKFTDSIINLRQEVLHPGGPESRVVYETDKNKNSVHITITTKEGGVVACGSLLPEDDEGQLSESKNRIRGMAVHKDYQGRGFGVMILNEMLEITKKRKIGYTWCNARVSVLPFYEKKGFKKVGEVFDVPGSGAHYKMILSV